MRISKERSDKLTWLILNHVISVFGLRMKEDELVFIYKTPQDGCKNIYKTDRTLKGGDFHIIPITTDLNRVFDFVGLDRDRYENGFDNWLEYNNWIMKNCSYLTRVVITSLEHGVESDSLKTDKELFEDLKKFLLYVRLSHEEIKDNTIFPALLYYNLKEDIVRNFFYDEELEEKFVKIKKLKLFHNELENKFNAKKMVNWIPALKDNPELVNMFARQYIQYTTSGKVERFPDHLIDSEVAELRREAVLFYEHVFISSDEYKIYIIEGEDEEASQYKLDGTM